LVFLAAADIIIIRHDDVELIVYNEAQLCCFCCSCSIRHAKSVQTHKVKGGKKKKREKDNEILFFSFFFVVGRYVPGLLSMRNISLIRAAPGFSFYQMDGRRNIGTELDPIR
jgi:hypothetical protein